MLLLVMLLGLVIVPVTPQSMGNGEIKPPPEELIIGSEYPELGTYLGEDKDGDLRFGIEAESKLHSKALSLLAPDSVNKNMWGDNGDGHIASMSGSPAGWSYDHVTMTVGISTFTYESWLSIKIASTFYSSSVVKSIDDTEIHLKTQGKTGLEGNEIVQFREMLTDNACGYGGWSGCDSKEEIDEMARSGSYLDVATSSFAAAGSWTSVDITAKNWLQIGDEDQINFFLEEDNFGTGEYIVFHSSDSSDNPHLRVEYTLWAAPTANSVDITNEPSVMLPGQNYVVSTVVSDGDGYANLNYAYLYLSEDHTNNRVRFDWSQSSGDFDTGEGATFLTLNTTASNATTVGNTATLWWNFTITENWTQGYMDFGNRAVDDQGKSTTNWNDENIWYTDRLWLQTLTVEWVSESVNLTDGGYVQVNQTLLIYGYYYWNQLTTVYNLALGNATVDLWNGSIDSGATYNDTIDVTGFFNITYITPLTEDWTWSLDVVLDVGNLPSGLTEGVSNDNGKNPLFLVNTSPTTAFGVSGDTVLLTIQPANQVLDRFEINYWGQVGSYHRYTPGNMLYNDGNVANWRLINPTRSTLFIEFDIVYPLVLDDLVYDILISGATLNYHTLYIPEASIGDDVVIYSVGATTAQTGTYALDTDNVINGVLYLHHQFTEGGSGNYETNIDQLIINYTSFTLDQVATRIFNGTTVLDYVEYEVLASDTNVTISGLPTTYIYSHINKNCSLVDNIAGTGAITLYDTVVGTYRIYFDTGMTWHNVAFSPTLPDGLSIDWQIFEWYLNTTQLNQMPYPVTDGFYNLFVKDGFDNEIVVTNITIAPTDPWDIMYGFETLGMIPLYELSIPSNDKEEYYIGLERGDTTTYFALPPFSETQGIRVYGTSAGTNYTLTIYQSEDDSTVRSYPISMPDNAYVFTPIDEIDDFMDIDIYNFRTDDNYWYIDITTRSGGATIDVYEDDVLLFDDYNEGTEFVYEQDTITGRHTIDVIVSKTGYENKIYNSSYYVVEVTLYISLLVPPSQSSEGNVSMTIVTNWGNCTLTIDEYIWDPSVNGWGSTAVNKYTAVTEGSVSWSAQFESMGVKVDVLINGTAQSLTRTFYYSKAHQDVRVNVAPGPPVIIPGAIVTPSKWDTFMSNLPYIIIVGGLMIGALAAMTKSERLPPRRKKKKGKSEVTESYKGSTSATGDYTSIFK